MAITSTIQNPTQWAQAFITKLGGTPRAQNTKNVVAWEAAEGGNWNNTARYNPINTTQKEPGSVSYDTGAAVPGIQAYTSWTSGLTATVQTLEQNYPHYHTILEDILNTATTNKFASDVGASPWGTPGASIAEDAGVPYAPANAQLTSAQQSTGAASTSKTVTQQSGVAAIFQYLDAFLNPGGTGGLLSILNVGSDVEKVVLLVVDRGVATIFFLGVTVVGVYLLLRQPLGGGVLSAGRLIQRQQHIYNERVRLTQSAQRLVGNA